MAFVTATPIPKSTLTSQALGGQVSASPLRVSTVAKPCALRMGYGAYSYLTDKTKGHTNQYYVDKFRIASDFSKGVPTCNADAKLGRDAKGAMLVPKEGIPQEMGDALPARVEDVDEDPRIAESEGAVYEWDLNYVDPQFLPSTYADVNNEEVAATAFAQFRGSTSAERGASITRMNFGAEARVQRIKAGIDEKSLLTLDGQLDVDYARLQKICNPPTLSPTGVPQTEIPGYPYVGSVGALDFMEQKEESVASFWKDAVQKPLVQSYKKPSGAATADLPYNVAPSVALMQEQQEANGLIKSE